ncbi:MAG: NAD(P)H-dependent oxidoreductase [Myxococcota bacterium]
MSDLRILGLAGSLRPASLNRALLRAAASLVPAGVELQIFDLDEIPLYRGDVDTDADRPASVTALKNAISGANGVLIATPEYNYGVPGVLKNALDWASRPAFVSPFRDKPSAIVGASPGLFGAARAQAHLKLHLLAMGSPVFAYPEFCLGQARSRMDGDTMTDDKSREMLTGLLAEFAEFCRALQAFGRNRRAE